MGKTTVSAEGNMNATAVDALRGGAIGIVSGIKGGALSGAIAGILLAVSTTLTAGEWIAVLFATLAGATYGGMGTAVVGAIWGSLSGALSAWLLIRSGETNRIPYLWWGMGTAVGLFAGWYFVVPVSPLAIVLGGLCGWLAGWVGGRDFVRVVATQDENIPELVESPTARTK